MELRKVAWVLGLVAGVSACSSDDKEMGQSTGGSAGTGGGSGGTGGTAGSSGSAGSAGSAATAGVAGAGGAQDGCTKSGGTVATGLCCQSTGDFPNTCLVGACGCAPANSHDVQVCDCPAGTCFDGNECTGAGGSAGAGGAGGQAGAAGSAGAGGAAAGCLAAGGTIVTQLCCQGTGDFPNLCLVGACGCAPANSHDVQACSCPTGKCFDGTTCQ